MFSKSKLLFLGLVVFLALSCSDLFFFRSTEDYFPLVQGSEWKYLTGNDTIYVQVAGDTSIAGLRATVVNVDFSPQFYYKERTQVRKFYRHTKSQGGTEYLLEQRYRLLYVFPLVKGNSWRETFQDTIVIQGTDTVHYYHRLEAVVTQLEDVATPAGSFSQCYRLDFTEEIRDPDTTVRYYSEWLAPGVGIVKWSSGAEERQLAYYRIGP